MTRSSAAQRPARSSRRVRSAGGIASQGARAFGWVIALALGWAIGVAPVPLVPAPARAETACRDAFMDRIQTVYQGIRSFSGRFTQEDRQKDGKVLQAQGQVAYERPGRMRWNYEPPNEQLVVTDGRSVWLYDPLLDNVTVQPLEEVTQGTPLAFLLGVGNLARDFACRPLTRPAPPAPSARVS